MRFLRLLGVTLSILALYGCRSAPITYYTLTPADRSGTPAESARPAIKAIVVLRSLPAGIDTPQILFRTDDTQLRVEESGRWVAPLGDELRGALVDALRHQYGIIVLDSARHNDTPVPRINLTVRKFDLSEGWPIPRRSTSGSSDTASSNPGSSIPARSISGPSITLAVDWTLSTPGHEPNSALSCQAEFREPSAATVGGAVAAAQAAILKLSQTLGAAIAASSNGATPTC